MPESELNPVNPGSAAIQAHVGRGDTTHGVAPEASAARLIRLLRANYLEIGTRILTEVAPLPVGGGAAAGAAVAAASSVSRESIISTQASLIAYIREVIEGREPSLSAEERTNPHIAHTIKLIDLINGDKFPLSAEDKRKVLTQMASIAGTCPDMASWNDSHRIWSTNRIYNPETHETESVTASPAETLNLVCRALLDTDRYKLSASGDERDFIFRVESLSSSLLTLQNQKEAGQYELCSAGRQHELLFLLNRTYLDKPRADGGQAIELIESTGTFLVESASLYMEEALEPLPEAERARVVLDWARWDAGLSTAKESPIIMHLQATQGDAWGERCKAYLSARCEAFGLDPATCKLDAMIENLSYLSVPAMKNMLMPLIKEILAAKPLSESFRAAAGGAGGGGAAGGGAGGAGGVDEMHHLIALSNAALARMKASITPESWERNADSLRGFYTALEMMRSLHHYRELTVFLGEADGEFNSACQALQGVLLEYYSGFSESKRLPDTFSAKQAAYLEKERAFAGQSQVDFVENFFASLSVTGDLPSSFARLRALKTPAMERHPLLLSDDDLERWYRESVTLSPDGRTWTMDISPYQINRILLQAFLVSPRDWTERYVQALQLLTQWLLKPIAPEDPLRLRTLKAAYPGFLLTNLLLSSLLTDQSFMNAPIKEYLSLFYENQSGVIWSDLLRIILGGCTTAEISDILTVVQGQLGTLIQNGAQLRDLLALPLDRFNAGQRTQLWTAIQGQLGTLIQNGAQLYDLLALSLDKFNADQRTQLLTAIQGQLGTLIQNGSQLRDLLLLPLDKFNAGQRTQLWTAIQEQLGTLIQDGTQLRDLLLLPLTHFSEDQRTQLWTATQRRLGTLIQEGCQLCLLLALPLAHFRADQRTQLLTAVERQLGTLIQNGHLLCDLLELPLTHFDAAQRMQLWTAIQGRLGTLIQDGTQLRALLRLSLTHFSEDQRTQLWTAIQGQLGTLIQNGYQLRTLLLLPLDELSEDQRTQLWTAIQGQLGTLIQDGDQLHDLLALPLCKLSAAWREQILTSVPASLSEEYRASLAAIPDPDGERRIFRS